MVSYDNIFSAIPIGTNKTSAVIGVAGFVGSPGAVCVVAVIASKIKNHNPNTFLYILSTKTFYLSYVFF